MAASRPSWKGYLKISLVSVPVRSFVGSSGETPGIRFHQLHRGCHSRIRYVKTCPIHGEVPNEEIVSGYEFAKDQYVEIDPSEFLKLRPEGDRAINVDMFVPPKAVDEAYLAGRSYYLLPDGRFGEKPYQLIAAALEAENLQGIGRMVITTREHTVRIRPVEGVLTVDLLEYPAERKSPADFKQELVETHPSAPEKKLTRQLIASMAETKLDLAKYTDEYTNQVRALIQAKVEGKQLVTPAPEEEPQVVNLMNALRQSMAHARRPARPSRRKTPSATHRPLTVKSAARRKKSG